MFTNISLRERKFAETRLNLLKELIRKLDDNSFESISVKELCLGARISEATFFNYFNKKGDLLVYFIALWSIEVQWNIKNKERSGLKAILEVFNFTAEMMSETSPLMVEFMSYYVSNLDTITYPEITLAEKYLAFESKPGIEKIKPLTFRDLMKHEINNAIQLGELKTDISTKVVLTGLASIFYGVPLTSSRINSSIAKSTYRKLLKVLWDGLNN